MYVAKTYSQKFHLRVLFITLLNNFARAYPRVYCTPILKKPDKIFKLYGPFYGWVSTASRIEPLLGGSLVFTTNKPNKNHDLQSWS